MFSVCGVKKADNTENVLTTATTIEQQPVSEKPQTTITEQIISIFKTINKALTTVWQ